MLKHLLIATTALALAACGKTGFNSAADQASLAQGAQTQGIINGTAVAPNDPIARSIVSIIAQYPVPNDPQHVQTSLCTGSIISPTIILTAAHCVYGLQAASVHVLFGNDVSAIFAGQAQPNPAMVRAVHQIKVHGFYGAHQDDAQNFYDIALVSIEGALPAGYVPAPPLTDASQLKDGELVLLAGYGITNGNPPKGSNAGAGVLREVFVPIKTAAWTPHEVLIDQSGNPTRGACHGDSGGPAYVHVNGQTLLFGVTSRGVVDPIHGDGAQSTNQTPDFCNHYAAYTNILGYRTWLGPKISQMLKGVGDSDDDGGASKDPLSKFGAHRKQF